MFLSAQEIEQAFTAHDLKYRVQETETSSRVALEVQVAYTAFCIWYFAGSDRNDIAVRVPNYVRFQTEAQYRKMLKTANDMNRRYRFCKFTVNSEEQCVTLEYDFPMVTDNVGETAVELFHRISQIGEDAYPVFMRALWGGEEFFGNVVFYDYQF